MNNITNNWNIIIDATLNDVGNFMIKEAKRSFASKSFNGKLWKKTILQSRSKGNTVRSLKKRIVGNSVKVYSNLLYTEIQNSGGKIKVTEKMKKYFWSQFYKTKNVFWKNAALTKKRYIILPERKYLDVTQDVVVFAKKSFERNLKKYV